MAPTRSSHAPATAAIVNADDFGHSPEANEAIVEAFQRGIATHVSMLANMPAFLDAVKLAEKHSMLPRAGIHLNLMEGYPLTRGIAGCERFCSGGAFTHARPRLVSLSRAEKDALKAEMLAQIALCSAHGIRSHIDSHLHCHTEWPLGSLVIDVARECGIEGVRVCRNTGRIDWYKRPYIAAYNARLSRCGLARSRWFGSFADVMHDGFIRSGTEIMIHPEYGSGRALRDRVYGLDLSECVEWMRRSADSQPCVSCSC